MLLRRCSRRGFCCALRRRAERQHDPVRRASDHQSATCREASSMRELRSNRETLVSVLCGLMLTG